jgi:hypothetical protein
VRGVLRRGTVSPKAEVSAIPESFGPRIPRSDLSLTALAAVAGQMSREASPLPGGGGSPTQLATMGMCLSSALQSTLHVYLVFSYFSVVPYRQIF